LLIGVPVAVSPNYPDLSDTNTTWQEVPCHHCKTLVWLGLRQLKCLTEGTGIAICPRCAVHIYGVTENTPMTPLTHERKG